MNHPIENIKWIPAEELDANEYNPNVVYNQELKLLALSIMTNGYIQPLLIDQNNVIIDGFHRYSLALNHKGVRELTKGRVPCAVLDLTMPERMMLTVRINRAKGSHISIKMHDLVTALIKEHEIPAEEVAKQIGATKAEVNLLLMEGVFKKLDVQNHKYSKAWVPK